MKIMSSATMEVSKQFGSWDLAMVVVCHVIVLTKEIVKASIIWQECFMTISKMPFAHQIVLVSGRPE